MQRQEYFIKIIIGKPRRDGKYPVTTIFPTGRRVENLAASYCAAMNIKERYEGGIKHGNAT